MASGAAFISGKAHLRRSMLGYTAPTPDDETGLSNHMIVTSGARMPIGAWPCDGGRFSPDVAAQQLRSNEITTRLAIQSGRLCHEEPANSRGTCRGR